jgi:hypothetical protein
MAPHCPYYSLAKFPYLAIIIERYEGPLTALTISLHRRLSLATIMDSL